MPSLAAAPDGPDTRPRPSRRAASIISFSWAANFRDSSSRLPRKPALIHREILRVGHDYGSLDDVLQFANVTRPGVRLKHFQALFIYRADILSCFTRVAIDEVLNQYRNVFPSFPQRRHLDGKNVEPVKEVTPK